MTNMLALVELARSKRVALCGKDLKTGQSFMKTLIAPGLKVRLLGVSTCFSSNTLGKCDGEVVNDAESFNNTIEIKLFLLDRVL